FGSVCRTIAVSEPQSRRMSPSFVGLLLYVFCLDEEVGFAPALVPLLLFVASCCPVVLHELQPARCILPRVVLHFFMNSSQPNVSQVYVGHKRPVHTNEYLLH
ncbi:unnamed protein product, partial [Ectocarpus sp. 12 AP-2014]